MKIAKNRDESFYSQHWPSADENIMPIAITSLVLYHHPTIKESLTFYGVKIMLFSVNLSNYYVTGQLVYEPRVVNMTMQVIYQ